MQQIQTQRPTRFLGIDVPLWLLSFSHFLNDGSANFLPGILPLILVKMGQPISMAAVLMAALLLGQSLQPFTGLLAERANGRRIFLVGLTLSTLGGALLGFAQVLPLLIIDLVLIGVGNAVFHPQALAITRGIVSKERQALSFSFFLVGGEFGRGIWPVITSLLVVHFGLHSLWVLVIPLLFTLPILLRTAPVPPVKAHSKEPIHWKEHRRPLFVLVGMSSLRSFILYSLVTDLPLLWHLRGGSLVGGATLITILLVVGIIGNLGGGHLSDRFGRQPVLFASTVGSALFIPFLANSQGVMLWIFSGIVGVLLFASVPLTVLLGQDIFSENKALGSGLALGLSNGIGATLLFISGAFLHASILVPFVQFLGVVSLVTAILIFFMPQKYLRTAH